MSTVSTIKSQEIGARIEDFAGETVGGGKLSLSVAMAGKKAAVVVFWSGVCSHCLRYDEYLNRFAGEHPDIGLLAVASRQQETPAAIRKTIAERNLNFPVLYDSGGLIAKQWFTEQTPRVFLIDSSFTLRYRGAIDNFKFPDDPEYVAYLEPAISDFMSGRPIAQAETASFGCAIQSVYYNLPKTL
jgi:peroxiredoxin